MKMTWHGGLSNGIGNLLLPEGDAASRGAPPIGGLSLVVVREELPQIVEEILGRADRLPGQPLAHAAGAIT